MTIAITGATGFVGSHVLDLALAGGHSVRALVRQAQPHRDGVTWVGGALDDAAALARLCNGADALIHIAGAVNAPSRAAFAAANSAGTQAVANAASTARVRRFVHVSSLAAREPGLSDYGWSKAQAETAVTGSSLNWVIVRPPGIYGPRDNDTLELFRMARRGVMLLPPGGRGSWIFAPDLARLLLSLAAGGPDGLILEPDDGAPISHRDLALRIGAAVGRPQPLRLSAPRWLVHLAARADRIVRGQAAKLTPDRARYMTHPDWTCDPDRRPSPAFWQPQTSLDVGLAETAGWYRAAGWLAP